VLVSTDDAAAALLFCRQTVMHEGLERKSNIGFLLNF
jgi:hypothetical protein